MALTIPKEMTRNGWTGALHFNHDGGVFVSADHGVVRLFRSGRGTLNAVGVWLGAER